MPSMSVLPVQTYHIVYSTYPKMFIENALASFQSTNSSKGFEELINDEDLPQKEDVNYFEGTCIELWNIHHRAYQEMAKTNNNFFRKEDNIALLKSVQCIDGQEEYTRFLNNQFAHRKQLSKIINYALNILRNFKDRIKMKLGDPLYFQLGVDLGRDTYSVHRNGRQSALNHKRLFNKLKELETESSSFQNMDRFRNCMIT
ncbi:unnamed protein product [Lepeophtheirus salmonis]|uniref:(salmon louse) hypothetical protein n=1 Tax=Lepeophtheirus salmonis TaxID=72036 RepID=A0A817F9W9_LEPSM|nr:unnamed protein product [Lepeophtheirus salmonis]CAG9476137.1 unnamed protein product [Lepeophtheirus salmonis]